MARTTPTNHEKVARGGAYTAGQIAALCSIMAEAFGADPDKATIGEAVEGLGAMARKLNDDLLDLAEALA